MLNSLVSHFMEEAFLTDGMPQKDANIVAGLMADADLNGSDSHGIFRLPTYIKRLKSGGVNLHPNIRVERESSGMALLNGDDAMGHLVMRHAANLAVEKAKKSGVAWVGTHHSNHAGPAGLYAKIPMKEDMIGLYVAVGNANHLPPWGGTEMLLSTNPIAVAIPAMEEPPIVLDMATTVSSMGKVKAYAQQGKELPEGWMIDQEGQPLTDPNRIDEGLLLPIGGYKGFGLGLIFGLLAGTLNGAAFGKDVVNFNKEVGKTTNTGQFIIAISIEAFADVQTFKTNVYAIIRSMKASPTQPGVDAIRMPGEQSYLKRQERIDQGIPLHSNLLKMLDALAEELKIAPLVTS